MCLKRSWSDFGPQAYYQYGEDQNHETSFKVKALQAVVDSWCKIQVIYRKYEVEVNRMLSHSIHKFDNVFIHTGLSVE